MFRSGFSKTLLFASATLFIPALAHAASPEDFQWDLTYRSALERHPIPANEFMRMWPARLEPDRPIMGAIAAYAGAPVQATLLIEKPDSHAGEPVATWFVKTGDAASVCTYYRKGKGACQPLDPVRVERFVRDVLRFPDLGPQTGRQLNEKGADGKPVLLNYHGFLSVYVDGVALQRPVAVAESIVSATGADPQAGRLERALAGLVLSPDEARKHQAGIDERAGRERLGEAAASGNLDQLRRLLESSGGAARPDLPYALGLAAGNGRQRVVDYLLERGAGIDADESRALKAAVRANDEAMVRHLFERGAHADPLPAGGARIVQGALALAVQLGNRKMAQLLLDRGAKVNLVQSQSVLATAVSGGDPAMVELVVDAGANVNAMTPDCVTAWSESVRGHATSMTALLQTLGADPALHERCMQKKQLAEQGSTDGVEARARVAISSTVVDGLRSHDYAKLDALYTSIKDPRQVTPAGRSKLGIFYYALRTFPASSRDTAYWGKMHAEAAAWKARNPRSIPARMFDVYLYLRRTQAWRGSGYYNTLTAEERKEVGAGADATLNALVGVKAMMAAAHDPEWDHAMLNLLPYSNFNGSTSVMRRLEEAAGRYPDYEDLYFTAAWYQTPDYLQLPDARDAIARYAEARHDKAAAGLYARVYWYLDQMDYHGTLFDTGFADWPTMRTSFASIVAQYPDPWNLNAYAYFACKAGDYATMAELLERIGDNLVAVSWGQDGVATYNECAAHAAQGDAAGRARFEAAQAQVRQKRVAREFYEFIGFGTRMRNLGKLETSLASLRKAEDIDRQLGRNASMVAQYHIGMTLAKMGRHEEAIDAYSLGLRSQPSYDEAYWRRGLSFAALGRHEEAQQDFGTGASLFRRHPRAELAALNGDARAIVLDMQKTFREAGFDTPDF